MWSCFAIALTKDKAELKLLACSMITWIGAWIDQPSFAKLNSDHWIKLNLIYRVELSRSITRECSMLFLVSSRETLLTYWSATSNSLANNFQNIWGFKLNRIVMRYRPNLSMSRSENFYELSFAFWTTKRKHMFSRRGQRISCYTSLV